MNFRQLFQYAENGLIIVPKLKLLANREDIQWESLLRDLYRWQKQGLLQRIVKGVYQIKALKTDPLVAATQIHSDTYISLGKALMLHGIIPDRVYGIDIVCPRRIQSFTVAGIEVVATKIPPSLYWGFDVVSIHAGSYRIAYPEKALFDFVYLDKSAQPTVEYFESLRIETDGINIRRMWEISAASPKMQDYVRALEKYIEEEG